MNVVRATKLTMCNTKSGNFRKVWCEMLIEKPAMRKKSNLLFLCVFILTILSLFSALIPVLDIDADGYWDSLITEGFLLAAILCASVKLLRLSTRFTPSRLLSPWLLSFLLILPPITTL